MKSQNTPICPFDKKECIPNFYGFMEMDGYLNCNDCPRYHSGVRETGGMPNLEWVYNIVKKLFKYLKNDRTGT